MQHPTQTHQPIPFDTTGAGHHRSPDDLAIAGWLARYGGNTAETYRTHMRVFVQWCVANSVRPLELKRPQIELFLRHCERERGNRPQSVEKRLNALRSFYTYAVYDEYIPANPASLVRAPVWHRDESRLVRLGRREVDRLVAAAAAGTPCEEALITLLLFLGLRNHEARAVRVEHMTDIERGHRVVHLIGKGSKAATLPLPVVVARSLERAIGGRTHGPLLLCDWGGGQPLSAASARTGVRRVAHRAGLDDKHVHPHALRHAMITMALELGLPLHIVQDSARHADPRTTMAYSRARHSLDKHAAHTLAAHFGNDAA